jgi:hypothetical protein
MKVLYTKKYSVTTNEAVSGDYDAIALWQTGQSYAKGALVIRQTPANSPSIDIAAIDYIYEAAGNDTATDPLIDKLGWINKGATDKYRAFDEYTNTQSAFVSGSILELTAMRVSALFLGQFDGNATLEIWTGSGANKTLVFSREIRHNVFLYDAAYSWTSYFFRELLGDLGSQDELSEFPAQFDSVTIRLTAGSSGFRLGRVTLGTFVDLGLTRAAPNVGIFDYSVKETNDEGDTYLQVRRFAKTATYDLLVPTGRFDIVYATLKELRARPTVWVGDDLNRLSSLRTYGFFRDFSLVLSGNDYCECNLEIEGLI